MAGANTEQLLLHYREWLKAKVGATLLVGSLFVGSLFVGGGICVKGLSSEKQQKCKRKAKLGTQHVCILTYIHICSYASLHTFTYALMQVQSDAGRQCLSHANIKQALGTRRAPHQTNRHGCSTSLPRNSISSCTSGYELPDTAWPNYLQEEHRLT